jgi:hypothetical protein
MKKPFQPGIVFRAGIKGHIGQDDAQKSKSPQSIDQLYAGGSRHGNRLHVPKTISFTNPPKDLFVANTGFRTDWFAGNSREPDRFSF